MNNSQRVEQQASEISVFGDTVIHPFVQTPAYARALLSTSSPDRLTERVADRMARQAVLMQAESPEVRILLGEAALHQQVGGPVVMRQQVRHLLEVAKRLPRVSIRVVPFSAGAHPALGVEFTLLRTADSARVHLEGLTATTSIQEAAEIETYVDVFTHLWQNVAAGDRESADLLRSNIPENAS